MRAIRDHARTRITSPSALIAEIRPNPSAGFSSWPRTLLSFRSATGGVGAGIGVGAACAFLPGPRNRAGTQVERRTSFLSVRTLGGGLSLKIDQVFTLSGSGGRGSCRRCLRAELFLLDFTASKS